MWCFTFVCLSLLPAHTDGGERKVCSFSWLRVSAENFPSSPPLPAPTSCLHYCRVFQATSMTGGSRRPVKTHRNTVVPFCRSSPRLLSVGTVCSAFAHRLVRGAGSEKGGWTRRNSTVRSSRKEGGESQLWEALSGRCYEPLGLNWAELCCRLAASWRPENPGITKSTASLVISVN